MKKLITLLLLLIFMAGVAPFTACRFDSADARTKKKIVRKKKRVVRKKRRLAAAPVKIVRSGPISQRYSLEEGADQSEAAGLIEELKSTGVEEASFDVDKNVLQVKYNIKDLSAIDIIKKLKDLGYTVKQIN